MLLKYYAAALLLGAASPAMASEVSPDGVPVIEVYLSDEGAGILRYEDPDGGAQEYVAAIGGLSDSETRPFEVMGALGGPWTGPKVAICLEYFRKDRMMGGALAIELYSNTEQKSVMRYRPVFDASKAEKIVSEGEGAGPGECSRKYAP